MWLKLIVLFALFINCFISFSQNEEPILLWDDTYKLSWNDFKDQPDPNTDVVAITASGITFQYSIKKSDDEITGFTTQVKTIFYPEKSWHKPERANKHILSHEQLHFDITELHSRIFRQQLSLLLVSENLSENLDSLYNDIKNDLRNMQNLYDAETDYSRIIEAQAKWQEQIQLELSKLSNFKSSM